MVKDSDLNNLWKREIDLVQEMEKTLISFVKENGGEIKTEDEYVDSIYGIFYNEGTGSYEEHKVMAVKIEHNQLLIFADVYPDEKENWFATDMIWRNATFCNLCETLPQYV